MFHGAQLGYPIGMFMHCKKIVGVHMSKGRCQSSVSEEMDSINAHYGDTWDCSSGNIYMPVSIPERYAPSTKPSALELT